jgi:DNA polymerase III delta prime subunit|tara:strand:+ start:6466 stop:7446 length:981 start_codon:yes stop_codon:yes gene_type:complete
MELPFIYKYQPLFLKDFEIDEELLVVIRTLISMDSLNVLFVGDTGCGKTSIISAIVREYYDGTVKNDNILSINSLKEQGISYYRSEVKTFCQTSSSVSGKKKIIILDDLDVINEQSQQVFRNCIDKYSDNVHFIASCMNTQKVIESLQSRMTIIRIKALKTHNLSKISKRICKIENIHMTENAEDFILSISNNSVRILINYLEKLKLLSQDITLEVASTVCTNIAFQDFVRYTTLCRNSDIVEAIKMMYYLFDKGYSVMDILDNYFLFVKMTPLLSEDEKYAIISIVCKYIAAFHNIHEDEIELALFTNNVISILEEPQNTIVISA